MTGPEVIAAMDQADITVAELARTGIASRRTIEYWRTRGTMYRRDDMALAHVLHCEGKRK